MTDAYALSPAHAERKGDWIQTFTGIQFWPLDPRPEEIDIRDIAHALSNQCRFCGHVNEFYSVAEHSVRCSFIVPQKDALWALLHDASEAYLVDLPRPLKQYSQLGRYYREAESRVMRAVALHFKLDAHYPEAVRQADNIMLVTEKRDLMKMPPKPWEDNGARPLIETIRAPFKPEGAERAFLQRFNDVTKGFCE